MRRLESMLVALDGSASSFHALAESIRLAQWVRGRVTAITVAPSYEGDLSLVGVKNIKAAMEGQAEEILTKAAQIAEAKEIPFRVICEKGEAHSRIIECAQRERSDLVVLGLDSCKSSLGELLGSTESKVIEQSPRNVLVIPENVSLKWERILLISDCSEYGQNAREWALELAVSYGGELKIAAVPIDFSWGWGKFWASRHAPPVDEVLESLRARAAQAGISCSCVDIRALDGKAIQDLAKHYDVNLLILGLEMNKRLLGLIPMRIPGRVLHRTCCPVLVVKDKATAGSFTPFNSSSSYSAAGQ